MKKLLFSMALAICATFSMASESKASPSSTTNVQATAPEIAQAAVGFPTIRCIVLGDGTIIVYGILDGKWYVLAII